MKKLDSQDIDWRDFTVLLLDNAPYHNSHATLGLMQALNIPVMFLGPHSYDAAPCELWFGWFKSRDVNPNRLP